MIPALIALLTIIFLSGQQQETYFLNPDIKKSVNTYVKDKDRKSEIKVLIKGIEKDQKEFLKKRKKYYNKSIIKLNLNYYSKREDVDKLLNEYFDARQQMMATYWDKESKIRLLFKEDEWNAMIENVLAKPDNSDKARKEFEKGVDVLFSNLEAECRKHIADTIKKESAAKAVSGQKEEILRFVNEYLSQNYKNLEALRIRTATKADFDLATASISRMRKGVLVHIADMRFEIVKNSTEAEWKKIAKEMENLFTNGKNAV